MNPRPAHALRAAAAVGVVNAGLWTALTTAVRVSWDLVSPDEVWPVVIVALVTFTSSLAVVLAALTLPARRRTTQIAMLVLLTGAIAVARTGVEQTVEPIGAGPGIEMLVWALSAAGYLLVASPALLVATLLARAHAEHQAHLSDARRARTERTALEQQDLQLRRTVSERLHGGVQNRLVVVCAGLDQLAAELADEGDQQRATTLREWSAALDVVREHDVRTISHRILPEGLEDGLEPALSAALRRLPAFVATDLTMTPAARRADSDLTSADRLLLLAAAEEALTNALRHGKAAAIAVHAHTRQTPGGGHLLTIDIDDNGSGPPPLVELSGLAHHHTRLQSHGGAAQLSPGPGGGGRLRITLPCSAHGDPAV